jgi:putative NADH-flavin reductase
MVRRPTPEPSNTDQIRVEIGDVLDAARIQALAAEQDAILWAIGARAWESASHLCSEGTKNVLWAMQRGGVKRLVCESAYGVGGSRGSGTYTAILRVALRARVRDKERQEQRIRSSSIEWVIVRPTILTNRPPTGRYIVGERFRVGIFPTISRADVAQFMLDQVSDDSHLRQAIGITSSRRAVDAMAEAG